jgi:hypothetical protein
VREMRTLRSGSARAVNNDLGQRLFIFSAARVLRSLYVVVVYASLRGKLGLYLN